MTANRIKHEARAELGGEFAADVMAGLSGAEKFLHFKYFYDKTGSELFEQICLQPEYYPSCTEAAILYQYSPRIAELAQTSDGVSIIEPGSGSSAKTRILFEQMLAKSRVCYFPIDISRSILQETAASLTSEFRDIKVVGIPLEYKEGMKRVSEIMADGGVPQRKLMVFLGSSIGNFEPGQSALFLRMVRENMQESDLLLVGFDLHKDRRVLDAAYNDKKGVTAMFNLNLLKRINAELGGDFDLDKFEHKAFYNKQLHRVEMHLVSKADQSVYVGALERSFKFQRGETIHTENSYKYDLGQIRGIAQASGFMLKECFADRKNWFCLALFSPDTSSKIY